MADERIVELEKKAAFQEHLLAELNAQIFEQQKMIDRLGIRLKALEAKASDPGTLVKPADEEEPPPHY